LLVIDDFGNAYVLRHIDAGAFAGALEGGA
jgi:hypothetical protein